MVAAYAVGYGVSIGESGRNLAPIAMCDTPDDTGCLLSWNSFNVSGDAASYIARSEKRFIDRYDTDAGKTLLCVNPLTFDRARPEAAGGRNLQVKSAACRDGVLYVDPVDPETLSPLPQGSLHMNDFSLFYDNVRADAVVRVKAFGARRVP
jgi:hypothetical protein